MGLKVEKKEKKMNTKQVLIGLVVVAGAMVFGAIVLMTVSLLV